MNSLDRQATAAATGSRQAAAESAIEGAKIGAAAQRKRELEESKQADAQMRSHELDGRAVYWERTISADGKRRTVLVAERTGAYSPAGFLFLCRQAARQAGRGRWRTDDAQQALAAELVCRVLEKTAPEGAAGRMPKRGSLGRNFDGREDPDLAYLTTMAARLIAQAESGEARATGLLAEAAPTAAADDSAADYAALDSAAMESAEGEADRYLTEPVSLRPGVYGPAAPTRGHYLRPEVRGRVAAVADSAGRRKQASEAAIAAGLRPGLRSDDWASAGLARSAGAFRTAATRGRQALADSSVGRTTEPVHRWRAAEWTAAERLAELSAADESAGPDRHPMETAPPTYRRPTGREWPDAQGVPNQGAPTAADRRKQLAAARAARVKREAGRR